MIRLSPSYQFTILACLCVDKVSTRAFRILTHGNRGKVELILNKLLGEDVVR